MLPQVLERESTIERLSRPGSAVVIERLNQPALLDAGCVVIIGLDAIRERMGAHWHAKRELVWEATERLLTRRLDPAALWARIGEVDFVVCASEEGRVSRALALRVLRELLEFFLGVQRFEDMKISAVVSIAADSEIACCALDPKLVERAGAGSAPGDPNPPPHGWSALSFASPGGHSLQLEFERERVCNLKNGSVIATRLWPVVSDEGSGRRLSERWPDLLSSASLRIVNGALIEYAKELYDRSRFGVFISCSIHMLSGTATRAQIVERLEGIAVDPTRPIIFELLDIDRGTPQSRVVQLVSTLAPYCRKVVARTSLDRPPLDLLRGCRLSGVSVDCGALQENPRDLMLQLSKFTEAVKRFSPLIFALSLKTDGAVEAAAAAGATHAGRCDSIH